MNDLLKSFPAVIDIHVKWGDMDAFQHVNNTIYFRYFESVRIAYLEKIDFMSHTEVGPILASIQCKFYAPVTYPDILSTGVKITEINEDRFTMSYRIISHSIQRMVAEGQGVIVSYDYANGKKTALPPEIRARIQEMERSSPHDDT